MFISFAFHVTVSPRENLQTLYNVADLYCLLGLFRTFLSRNKNCLNVRNTEHGNYRQIDTMVTEMSLSATSGICYALATPTHYRYSRNVSEWDFVCNSVLLAFESFA